MSTIIECMEKNPGYNLVWLYPPKKIPWNSELFVDKDQVAAIISNRKWFSPTKLFDIFDEGKHSIAPNNLPIFIENFPLEGQKPKFKGSIIFCSKNEYYFSGMIYGAESFGQAYHTIESYVTCKIQVSDVNLFFDYICHKKKTSAMDVIGDLKARLGKLRINGQINLAKSTFAKMGIDLLQITHETKRESSGGLSA